MAIPTVHFGKSDVVANPLGLGCNAVGGHNLFSKIDEKAGLALVHQAIDSGINLLDTAFVYGMGRSEELVGQAIQDYPRDQLVVASKGAQDFSSGEQVINNDPTFLVEQVDNSLRRLRTDYLDIFYIHFPDHDTPKAEAVGALQRLKEAGKIRAIGISNFSLDQIKEANADGYVDVVEDEFSFLHQGHRADGMLDYLHQNQISFVPYFPLASGLLTGKYTGPVHFAEDDIRSQIVDFQEPRYGQILNAVDQLRPLADAHDATVAQLVLAAYLAIPEITAVIPGAKRPEQVAANAKAMELSLTAEEVATIEKIFADFRENPAEKSLADPD